MKPDISSKNFERHNTSKSINLIRGKQSNQPLNAVIIGGGKACHDLLKVLDKTRLTRLRMNILGVSDVNPEAPGLLYAGEIGLFTTTDLTELFSLEGLNLIIELTGLDKVKEEIYKIKPSQVSIVDHVSARLIWDLIQIEAEKTELEREKQRLDTRRKEESQLILDSLPYRIMVVNMDKTIETVNKTFLKTFQLNHDEILGKHCYEVRYGFKKPCHELGEVCFMETDQLQHMERQGSQTTYKEYQDETGETRFDVITITPIFDEQGNIVQLLEASRDVSDRFKLEREALKSSTFLNNVFQSTVDGILVVDTKGYVLLFNEGMERLTKYSAQEISGHGHLCSFYDIETARENMRKMRSDEYGPLGKLNPTSMTITAKDGEEIPVTLAASIITMDEKEVGSVGVFTDMREFLQMRKELEEAHIQLVQSEKIASVGRMAAGVAHEINNPLSGILIYAEILKGGMEEGTEKAQDAQEIITQTLRCKQIVSDLLEFSRQSIGTATSFSIGLLITQCLNLLVNQASFQDIEVIKDIETNMPEMIGDMGQLQQVFTNLFINAADAMESKGKLTIKARFLVSESKYLITVTDTGPGIPDKNKDKIFDVFFTTKAVGKGTGLGLSISENIIKLHGGRLHFETPVEGGTRFIIEIPFENNMPEKQEPVFI